MSRFSSRLLSGHFRGGRGSRSACRRFSGGFLFGHRLALLESASVFLNAACRIDQFLLAGVKRMARAADFHFNVADGGADLEGIAAGAVHGRQIKRWV